MKECVQKYVILTQVFCLECIPHLAKLDQISKQYIYTKAVKYSA